MPIFDVSKEWRILAPASVRTAWNAANELARYTGLLRERAKLSQTPPPVEDAETVSPPYGVPVIILSAAGGSRDRNGFAWRIGKGRIEINGDSVRGLWNGVFDFLAALGIQWPGPGREELPSMLISGSYSVKSGQAHSPSASSVRDRRRLVISGKMKKKELEQLVHWAARNRYDAVVFSLSEKSFWNKVRRGEGIFETLERYALILEAGGWDMSFLLPRRLFFFHRDMFRMESGIRVKKIHFCPTNPQTITRIQEQSRELFLRASGGMAAQSVPPVFHLWPDQGHEKTWCACPACRAFSLAEQNRIAVNSAADVLADLNPQAWLSCFDPSPETGPGSADDMPAAGIGLRKNILALNTYPE